jgi:hypothetical protein
LDLNPTRLGIAELGAGIGDGFEDAGAEIVAGLRLSHTLFRDRNQAVYESELLLGMLAIEKCLLSAIVAREMRFAGPRV